MNHQPTNSHFENIRLRPTKITDISFVLGAEQDPTNALFVKQWTREEHVSALEDPNIRHWIIEAIDATSPLGHIIANGFCNTNRKIYLKRIVITIKDQGDMDVRCCTLFITWFSMNLA